MDIKKTFKRLGKATLLSLIYFIAITIIFYSIIKMFDVSERVENVMADFVAISFCIVYIVLIIIFISKRDNISLKTGKMNNYKDFIIMDELRHGGSVLAIYFYRYKDGKYDDCFFFTFLNRYNLPNADIFLNKIKSFCSNLPIITDRNENYKYLDKLFIVNNLEVMKNEKIAIDEYVSIKDIKKDFARSEYEFSNIDDTFIKCARNLNALSTKQLFDGKLLHILSYYDNLKEVL